MNSKLIFAFLGIAALLVWLAIRTGAAAGWTRDDNAAGFSIEHPAGWRLQATAANGIAGASQDASEFALIQPLFFNQPTSAQAVVRQLAFPGSHAFARASVLSASQLSPRPDEALASVAFWRGQSESRGVLLCAIMGDTGMLFAFGGPKDRIEQDKPALVRILRSFKFSAPVAAASRAPQPQGPPVSYVNFRDPHEGAFTSQVPAGWQVSGGSVRKSATDVRVSVLARSPDGISIFNGDSSFPSYMEPDPTLSWAGFGEGKWYGLPDGAKDAEHQNRARIRSKLGTPLANTSCLDDQTQGSAAF